MKKSLLLFTLVPLFSIQGVFAQGAPDDSGAGGGAPNDGGAGGGTGISESFKLENFLRIDNIQDLLAAILSAVVQIAIPFLVLAVMWVGFLFVAARGNPEKLTKAKQALFFTLLGALIILGAQTLSIVLSGTIAELTEGVNN